MCLYCKKTNYVVRDVWNDCLMQVYFHNQPNKQQIILRDEIENENSQYEITLEFNNNNLNRENLFKAIKLENKRIKNYDLGIRLELLE